MMSVSCNSRNIANTAACGQTLGWAHMLLGHIICLSTFCVGAHSIHSHVWRDEVLLIICLVVCN